MSYTKDLYFNIKDSLKEKFNYSSDLELPKISKISLNSVIKAVNANGNNINYILSELSNIAGQKAYIIKAKKSVSSFKLRENMSIGAGVTLRKNKLYEFLDRLIYVALPRIRDFRGLPKNSFNQSYDYNFGIKDHSIFVEVNLDKIICQFGMNINISIDAKSKEEALFLLRSLKFPIKY